MEFVSNKPGIKVHIYGLYSLVEKQISEIVSKHSV